MFRGGVLSALAKCVPQRRQGIEEKQKEFIWSTYHNLARDGYIESTCCCVKAKFLGMETKILFSLSWYILYSTI
jgi:hypothetical protein